MKKMLTPLLSCFFVLSINKSNAQLCSDIPITLVDDAFTFEASDVLSYGDSMLTFRLTNNHPTSFFAYPMAKLVPLSDFPPGMSISPVDWGWTVFASAWNVDSTATVHIYYKVDNPVPLDYTMTFQLWLNNLTPVTDSCYFTNNYVVNLNPSGTAITTASENDLYLFPNPVAQNQYIYLQTHRTFKQLQYTIADVAGAIVSNGSVTSDAISVQGLLPGLYMLTLTDSNYYNTTFKIVIQ